MKTAYQHTKKDNPAFYGRSVDAPGFVFCSVSGWAAKQESIKKKEINKSFNVGKTTSCKWTTVTETITVTHWSKSEVSIRVVIEAKARNDEKAQAIIDRVNIRMEKMGNTVSAVTSLRSQNGNGGSNESFTINYYVNMPSELTCDLTQKYGNIIMPENNKGKCDLHVKYGNLNGGNFTGPLSIDVQYGNMGYLRCRQRHFGPGLLRQILYPQRLATEYRQQSTPTSVSEMSGR